VRDRRHDARSWRYCETAGLKSIYSFGLAAASQNRRYRADQDGFSASYFYSSVGRHRVLRHTARSRTIDPC
jgi:hypothetical protein